MHPLLHQVQAVLEDAKGCVGGWCSPKWGDSVGLLAVVRKLMTSQWYQAEFMGLNDRLNSCMIDLSLALNIKQGALPTCPTMEE